MRERAARFLSRGWVADGSSQNLGSDIFFSMDESSEVLAAMSKMTSEPVEFRFGLVEEF
jgi:hypothetical protein